MLACVGGGGGGGGGGSPAIASGSTCTPSVQGETCGLHEGNSAHLKCDGTTWSSVQVCPAGTYCTSASGVYVCASTGGGSGDATTTDGASTTDSGAVSGDGGGNAKDTSIGGGDATVEVGPPLDIKQPPDTIVTKDADPPKACNGACTAAQKCNASTNKCYTPCGGPCASGKTCDESDGPPGVCLGGSSTGGSWGTDGNSSGVQKITSIAIAASGAGCDLTGDGVPDNSFAALASILGSQLGTAVEDGSLVILFDPKAWKTNGTAFQINLYTGKSDPTSSGCSGTAAGCKYQVAASSYDTDNGCTPPNCPVQVAFSNAKIVSLKLNASAPKFPLTLSVGSSPLTITISKVAIEGQVSTATQWQTTKNGVLCGAVTETDLMAAIDATPDEAFASIGGKTQAKSLIGMLLKKDVAINSALPNAYSMALNFETKSAVITGVAP